MNLRLRRAGISALLGLGLVAVVLVGLRLAGGPQRSRNPQTPVQETTLPADGTNPGTIPGNQQEIHLPLISQEDVARAGGSLGPTGGSLGPTPTSPAGREPLQGLLEGFIALIPGQAQPLSPQALIQPQASASLGGFPNPGARLFYTFMITPQSSDGEAVDFFLLYAPQGWQIDAIGQAPLENNSGCLGQNTIIQANGQHAGRAAAYWGITGVDFNDPTDPSPSPSSCGPYAPGTSLVFSVTLTVPLSAATCPGSPWVGIPLDPADPGIAPLLQGSMPSYLGGDGSGAGPHLWKLSWASPCPQPNLGMEKIVVTSGNNCRLGSGSDTWNVTPGTQVTYCYRMFNFSADQFTSTPLVTMSLQTIRDDVAGTIVSDWPLSIPGLQGGYTFTQQALSGAPGTCLQNTAVWTATTTTGYGQRPMTDIFGTFTNTTYTASATDSASVCFVPSTDGLKLPVILNDTPLP